VSNDIYSISYINGPASFAMSKNWNSTGSDWTRIYQGNVLYNQLTISSDGSQLYFLMNALYVTAYKVDASNGDILKKYTFNAVYDDQNFSQIALNLGIVFVSGFISGDG
jgi:hypothetical protein